MKEKAGLEPVRCPVKSRTKVNLPMTCRKVKPDEVKTRGVGSPLGLILGRNLTDPLVRGPWGPPAYRGLEFTGGWGVEPGNPALRCEGKRLKRRTREDQRTDAQAGGGATCSSVDSPGNREGAKESPSLGKTQWPTGFTGRSRE